jgi:hypothetical protein
MRGDGHVRFCGSRRVKTPPANHLNRSRRSVAACVVTCLAGFVACAGLAEFWGWLTRCRGIESVRHKTGDHKSQTRGATLPALSSMWQPAVPISANEAEHPHVAIDAQGDAVAAWESISGETNTVQAAVKPVEGAWGAPTSLSVPIEYSHGYRPFIRASRSTEREARSWRGMAFSLLWGRACKLQSFPL